VGDLPCRYKSHVEIGRRQINGGRACADILESLKRGCPVLAAISIFVTKPADKIAVVQDGALFG
jgi:hypothetical protein